MIDIHSARQDAKYIRNAGYGTAATIIEELCDEIKQLLDERHDLRIMLECAAAAENLNAEDAKKERAAVVAWLRGGAGLRGVEPAEEWDDLWVAARDIERGEHRREETK